MGVQVEMNNGYVMASLDPTSPKNVPPIGFIAHVDTSPEVTSENVRPIIHKNYQGGDIIFDNRVIVKSDDNDLKNYIGKDIITSDGTTLLGSDDKAGIAIIMDAIQYLKENPTIMHGPIKIAFTPDEEIGKGMSQFDTKKFGAKYAYTIDGGPIGEISTETFNADLMVITIKGKNVHPAIGKGKLLNSMKVASHFMTLLPNELAPESTDGRQGFVHCVSINGNVEETKLTFIIRDFEEQKLNEYEELMKTLLKKATDKFPNSSFSVNVTHQYRNMKNILDLHPKVEKIAKDAFSILGITPIQRAIRGGTDGSILSFMGIPCPNIFSGQRNIHSTSEWVPVDDLKMAVNTIIVISQLWEKEGN